MAKITDAYEAEMVDSTSKKKPASPLRRKKNKESQHTAEIIDITDVTEINDGAEPSTVPSKNKPEPDIYWMTEAPLMRRVSFEFKTDSNFHPKDAYLWNMDFHFFEDGEVVMGLNVVFENDSVMGEVKHVAQSGKQSIYLSTDSTYRMKSMNGFIYVPQDSVQDPHVLIRNISLTRYHRNEPDSLSMEATQK